MANQVPLGSNQYIGKGESYWDRGDGELFLGNVVGVSVQVEELENRQIFSSVDADGRLLSEVNFRRRCSVAIDSTEISKEIMELGVLGGSGALNNSTGSFTNVAITGVKQGRWYRTIGAGVGHKRNVTITQVRHISDTPVYTVTTDYKVDTVAGRIYIVPGGAIADGTDIEFSGTWAADTDKYVTLASATDLSGLFRFIGNPQTGPSMEIEIWDLRLTADGPIDFIGDDYAHVKLKGVAQFDGTQAAGLEYGRIIYR